jgi:hypothetical protein
MSLFSGTPQGATSAVTVTRPANTTAYSDNDVVGGPIEFPNINLGLKGNNAGDILITSSELEIDVAAIPSGMTSFNMYFYSVTPPSALADNSPFDIPAGDRASFLGKISLGTPVDEGSTLYIRTDQVNSHLSPAGTSIFAYLVTVKGFTPAGNSEVYKPTLHAIAL